MLDGHDSQDDVRAPEIRVRHDEDGRRVFVTVSGEIDLYSASILDATLSGSKVPSDVIIDCSEVRFMDSTGLNALVRHQQRLSDGGGSLRLRRTSEPVRHVLEVSGLADRLIADE